MASRLLVAAVLAGTAFTAAGQSPAGADLFTRRDKGDCLACHQLPAGAGPQSRADLGPPLEGARMRSLGRAGLRAILEDPTRANPDSVMPPYGRHHILEANEIERLVDYLHALP